MVDDGAYLASLQWAIDRQKSDYQDIRKQLRRYFVVIITVIFVRGFTFLRGDQGLLGVNESTSLAEDGVLWQTNTLPPVAGPPITEALLQFSALFSAIGGVLVLVSLEAVVRIETTEGCSPVRDTQNIIYKNVRQFETWVTENDEVLANAVQARDNTLRIGRHGVVLLIATYLLQVLATSLLIGALIILAYLIQKCYFMFKIDATLHRTRINKVYYTMFIVFMFTQPIYVYREIYGDLSYWQSLLPILVSLILVVYYLRSDIISFIKTIGDRYVGSNGD